MIAVDTNLLVYAADGAAGDRHGRAVELLITLIRRQALFLPLQVLIEFHHVATRKLGLAPAQARAFIEAWQAVATVVAYDAADAATAMQAHADHRIPIWDALVLAVCGRAGIRILASEDLQSGRTIGSVLVLDPFDPANAARLGLAG